MMKIIDVQLKTNYNWDDVRRRAPTWQTVKNEGSDWQQLLQTTLISQQVNVEVDLVENDWAGVMKLYLTWQEIKSTVSTWQGLKTF
ncbi:hypothetical protein [Desulforamulus aquiferis]|uniref:Uncharacterized protein n=1 Tax=Desulforamulus aquiferis TaxID=1397668 RepID=A0AAW7ZC63_9FIRM|nr:hypothetical protein [Desulforamulus aquiferis]MDO7787115.1 hypothetical protein [Desulforamulus aquiferis]